MDIIPKGPVLIVQALGFLVVLGILSKFLFKPVGDILDARRAEIDGQYASAEAQKQAAEELKADYEKHLASIEEEMRVKVALSIKEGQAIREEIIAESRAKADQILEKAQAEIGREKEIALAELKEKVADLTVAATSKLIDANLDEQKSRDLVDKFIVDLDEVVR